MATAWWVPPGEHMRVRNTPRPSPAEGQRLLGGQLEFIWFVSVRLG